MNQKVGYVRVSTCDQNLHLQRDALVAAGCEIIYEDKISGKNASRPGLDSCLKALRPGDTLVVWRLDRLGRSLADLVKIVTHLVDERQIGFLSLQEQIETNSASGKSVFHVFAALAEFERNLVSERTKAGLEAARARGRLGGRKPKLQKKDIREIRSLLKDGSIPVSDVAKRYGVSRTTIYNHVGVVSVQNSRGD
ncbi:DNA invertase Pin-like site-specific DNA recombinase [Aeromonas veronii]|uniref:recombinase family protein n=1 Tax=Aeromonas TaxID=642 RepID=UPI0016217BD0|nr:recombinase family protein [Aeromonas veronii]MCS3835057.1 DNA invertase Pin-like site-specific DNA recombinase [Aeromonas veronii]